MIVVSDASPLNVLIRIGHVDILKLLFQSVVIPPAVATELSHSNTPPVVRQWMTQTPQWLILQEPTRVDTTLELDDAGEREAISLALELGADVLLADDKKARRIATQRGLAVTGVLGVLEAAAIRGLLDLPGAFAKLRETNFRVAQRLLDDAIKRVSRRKNSN